MDAQWFNYLLAKWPNKPEKGEVPQYVLDNMQAELALFVQGVNGQLKKQKVLPRSEIT